MERRFSSTVLERLEQSRKELLDLGLRNPLLNHRRRAKQVPVIDELSAEIFRILVVEGKAMSFAAVPERDTDDPGATPDVVPGADATSALEARLAQPEDPGDGSPAARHLDTILQTSLESGKLHSRLLSIHRDARTYTEEQGVNILFLALGFLHWYESDSAPEARRAPLILVPVELERTNVQGKFRVRYSGDDIGTNLSLSEKLRAEFGIELPPMKDADALDVRDYLDRVSAAVEGNDRWHVVPNEMTLGFFSFGKFLMYRDLDPEAWQEKHGSSKGFGIVEALLTDGFRPSPSPYDDGTNIDEVLEPKDTFHVMDADSSQMLAIMDVMSGRNLVLQGPPGTGKSQTITNIIAEAVGRGKKVLFVSEKMAALDVVKRRLDGVGLGDAVLELHSHKTRKKKVLEELQRTLQLGKPRVRNLSTEIRQLTKLRNRLNDYSEAVNAPIGATRTSFIAAHGRMLENPLDEGMVRLDFSPMSDWSDEDYDTARQQVETLDHHLSEAGAPGRNPFRESRLTEFLPTRRPVLEGSLEQAGDAISGLLSDSGRLATAMGLETPSNVEEIRTVLKAAARALSAPDLGGLKLDSTDWALREKDLQKLFELGRTLNRLHRRFADVLIDEAWDQDLLEVRRHYASKGDRWWRFFSSDYRRARAHLRGLCRTTPPGDRNSAIELIDAVLESQRLRRRFAELASLGTSLYGPLWKGEDSDWERFERLSGWMAELHRALSQGELPPALLAFLETGPNGTDIDALVRPVEEDLSRYEGTILRVVELLELSPAIVETRSTEPLEIQRERLAVWREGLDRLGDWIRYRHIAADMQEQGLGFVLEASWEWAHPRGSLLRLFDHSWFTGLVERAYTEKESLKRFDKGSHEEMVKNFRRLDRTLFEYNRQRLVTKHWNALPRLSDGGELRILKREMNKKRRIMPIRRLLEEAGQAIQAIKPVFMMSPMSIATYAPPGSVHFDLVIFDEASQVKPVDAFGAIVRGDQAVVVGDSRQLPPTSFFDTLVDGAGDEEDFETVADMESILSLFVGKGAPERMLRWHYRSRHDSLIAVSNMEFYENRLMIFPSSGNNPTARGLRLRHLPDTAYERGTSRTNPQEAMEVAKAVMEHARENPGLSLGVVAFSTAQRDAIELHLELLRREDPSCEAFFAEGGSEPFFVKNLENVQGDERDVIFISIGYGRTAEGNLAMNFGPLNTEGGERRLNVLITRARMAMDVFTNFTADDLDLERSRACGMAALKTFLHYADKGQLSRPYVDSLAHPESPFEEAVLEALEARGIHVVPQVGTAGFFIDIGVKDPEKPGRFILGIECDGATYHSSRSARDRDRLRQEVLEGLGWRIHRIWSTAWFQDPEAELERTLAAIEAARRDGPPPGTGKRSSGKAEPITPTAPVIERIGSRTELERSRFPSYRMSKHRIDLKGFELHELPPGDLFTHVEEILRVEAPIHRDELAQRVAEAAGFRRTGRRIQSAVARALSYGSRRKKLVRRGDFIWLTGQSTVKVRNRSRLEASSKKIGLIPPEEIREALGQVIHRGFSLNHDEAISETARVLGFNRVHARTREEIGHHLAHLIETGTVQLANGKLTFADTRLRASA